MRETQEWETGEVPPVADKTSLFRGRPSRFPGAKRTETGWADGVFLLHAWRENFFDTLSVGSGNRSQRFFDSIQVSPAAPSVP